LLDTLGKRLLEIGNLPIYLGVTEQEIMDFINQFMWDNYLCCKGNKNCCVNITFKENKAVVELSSVEECQRLLKVESIAYYLFKEL